MIYAHMNASEIAVHAIATGHGQYVTNKAHYPEDKLLDTNFHLLSSIEKSKKIGPNTEAVVKKLFEVSRNHPLRNLTKVLGVLALKNRFTSEAIEHGSESALEFNRLSYNFIKSCAKNYRPEKIKTSLLPNRQLQFVCIQGGLL